MKAVVKGREIILLDSYPYKELIKEIPGRKWDALRRVWRVPVNLESIKILRSVVKLEPSLEDLYLAHRKLKKETEDEKTASYVVAIAPMPIKAKAFEHQIKGYNMALRIMGVME